VIITLPASQREHALITTNPVERAEQDSAGHADASASGESDQLALSQQETVALPRLRAHNDAAESSKTASSDNGIYTQAQ